MDRDSALALLKDVLAETVRADGPDLNVRQSAILLRVALDPGPHTVRGLAEALQLGKPAVSRALDALEGLGLAARLPDQSDRRSVLVQVTARGRVVLAGLGDRVIACERSIAKNGAPSLVPTMRPSFAATGNDSNSHAA